MTRRGSTRRYPRTARVNEVVREVIAADLDRMADPRLEVVTITGVEVSSDVRYADVYYSTLGTPEQADAAAAALTSVTGRLRSMLGREVRLRYTPELRWHVDPAIAQGARIEAVIKSLHEPEEPS
jgi:ribosome-binding factor A